MTVLERRLHIQDSKDCSCWPHDAIGYYNTNYSKTGKASLNADIFTCRCEWYWMMPKSQCQQGSTCVFRAFAAMLSMLSIWRIHFAIFVSLASRHCRPRAFSQLLRGEKQPCPATTDLRALYILYLECQACESTLPILATKSFAEPLHLFLTVCCFKNRYIHIYIHIYIYVYIYVYNIYMYT